MGTTPCLLIPPGIDSSSLFPGRSRIAALGEGITRNCSRGQVTQGLLPSRGEPIGAKGEGKYPPRSGNASPHPFAVVCGAHLSCDSLVLFRHDPRRNVVQASVNAIKQAAGGLPGKKIGIRFQGCGSPGRRRSRRRIPELEVAQDLFDDGSVFEEGRGS